MTNDLAFSINCLNQLSSGLRYVKAEFEAEGTRSEDLSLLKHLVASSSCSLVIKIGGSHAIRDITEASNLQVEHVLVPMIETAESLQLFLNQINAASLSVPYYKTFPSFLLNIETFTTVTNLDSIIDVLRDNHLFKGFVIGRSDLVGSLGLSAEHINSQHIYDICSAILDKCNHFSYPVTLGGGITSSSIPFITALYAKGLSAYETRKVAINLDSRSVKDIHNHINLSLQFERSTIKVMNRLSSIINSKSLNRIKDLESRL